MDKNKKFSANELNKFRAVLDAYGRLYGKVLISPVSDILDLKHFDKEREGVNPRLATPLKKYYTKATVITSIDLDVDANDKVVLIFNHDVDLTFPIIGNEKPKVSECTSEKIQEAIRNYNTNKQITFFTDVEAVTKAITSLNERTAKDIDAFAEELMSFSQGLRVLNDNENKNAKEYIESLKAIV